MNFSVRFASHLTVLFSRTLLKKCSRIWSSSSTLECQVDSLSEEEEVIRYALGYVPFSLKKKYQKSQATFAANCIELLDAMSVEGPESSFLDYTKDWVQRTNRGGLFQVKEMSTRDLLTSALLSSADGKGSKMNAIVHTACEDAFVRGCWASLTDKVDFENSRLLLEDIINLWLTIRGYCLDKRDPSRKAVSKLLMKSIGERDYLAHETCHLIMGDKLVTASREFKMLHFENKREIDLGARSSKASATVPTAVEEYMKRSAEAQNLCLMD